ncbi:MAG: YjjG family noncanonical pyrimidine nucleotidase [Muribaculaceae bacterium]|nr:YjjG family noncanonical pyrimidine nucleotidase [Muribaculaceae bacterium]
MLWFDLDDTLWDMTGNSTEVLRRLHAEVATIARAYPEGPESWLDTYHRMNAELWRDYALGKISRAYLRRERFAGPLRAGGIGEVEAVATADYLDTYYLKLLGRCTRMLPGARELLESIERAKLPKPGIISNGFVDVQHNKLRSSGIADCFSSIILSDDIGVNKPDRRLFDYALEQSGTSAEESTIVGDNPMTDILGALRAGWARAIWYNPKGLPVPPELEPYLAGGLKVASTLEEVGAMIGALT